MSEKELGKFQHQCRTNILESILSELPEHIYWVDINNVILGCNDLQAKSLGFKKSEDAIGKNISSFLTPEQRKIVIANNDEVIRNNKAITKEEPLCMPDGKEHYFISKKTPLHDKNGKVIGVLGISIDITELKIAQQETVEAKTKAQTEEETQKAILTLTGIMSHDLRTPLSSIALVDSLLSKTLPILVRVYQKFKESNKELSGDDPDYISAKYLKLVAESYQNISDALKQADSYIGTTLKMVKGVATGVDLIKPEDLVDCSIEDITRRVIWDYPCSDADKEKIHSDTMQGFIFRGNSIFIARILQNLIKNAFEQVQLKGRGEIFIKCEEGDQFNYLHVKDTAGGVTQALVDHLFDGFNTTKKDGTGLGLSSAKRIMQAFGGDINCQLVDGDCIEFSLVFPK